MTWSDYPYSIETYNGVTNGTCNYQKNRGKVVSDGFSYVPENSVFELQAALLLGPVAVYIDSSSTAF
jgi:hypothetical protein